MQTYLLDELLRDHVAQLDRHVHLGQLVDQRLDGTLTLTGTCVLKMNFKNVISALLLQVKRDAARLGVIYVAHGLCEKFDSSEPNGWKVNRQKDFRIGPSC